MAKERHCGGESCFPICVQCWELEEIEVRLVHVFGKLICPHCGWGPKKEAICEESSLKSQSQSG